jgi:hypothetical protein
MINFKSAIAAACFTLFLAPTSYGQDLQIGSNLQGLLKLAKERNPDLASMSFDANAASERVIPAGSLPDPKFRTEWRDITRTHPFTQSCWKHALLANARPPLVWQA